MVAQYSADETDESLHFAEVSGIVRIDATVEYSCNPNSGKLETYEGAAGQVIIEG